MGATSAWATETNATLDHTASVKWGSNTGANTLDAEQEYFNNDTGTGWAGAAFAKFSFTLPVGESITSATLSWKGTSGKGYGSSLYYLNVGQTFDFSAAAAEGTKAQYSGNKTLIDGSVVSLSGGVSVNTDVTAAVSAVVAGSQNYIIFQWTGNGGGANLYGKGSSDKPVLVITTTSAVLYTATFTETNSLTPTITIFSDSEMTESVTNGTLLDGTTYYYKATLTGYRNYTGSFTVSGANPSVNFTMTPKTTFTYNVYAVNSSNENLQAEPIATKTVYEDETATVAWSKYIKISDQWYVTSETSFYASSTEAGSRNVVYAPADIAYFFEMENLTRSGGAYLTEESDGYSNHSRLRLSKGSTYYTSALAAGVYQLTINCSNSNSSASDVYVYTRSSGGVLSEKLHTHSATSGSTTLNYVITVPDGYSIAFNGNEGGSANNNARMDYMTLTRLVPVTVGANGYTTFASPFALDLTDANRPVGLKAYKATLVGSTLSFTALNQTVAAGTGLLLLGETKGGTYNIPVVATGDAVTTAFVGVTSPTAKQSIADDTYYFVMKKATTDSDPLTFAPLSTSTEVTIPAGKAYIQVANSAFTSPARLLNFTFDDATTGITAVQGSEVMVNGSEAVYNLNGQRVAQPRKGLYIVNGKKVIIK